MRQPESASVRIDKSHREMRDGPSAQLVGVTIAKGSVSISSMENPRALDESGTRNIMKEMVPQLHQLQTGKRRIGRSDAPRAAWLE